MGDLLASVDRNLPVRERARKLASEAYGLLNAKADGLSLWEAAELAKIIQKFANSLGDKVK